MAIANVGGDFCLPLVFIHNSAKPRCLAKVNMSSVSASALLQLKECLDGSDNIILLVSSALCAYSEAVP